MILTKIQNDLRLALKKKDKMKAATLRFLVAAIRNREIELKKKGQLADEEIMMVIKKQVKQHRESIDAYQKGSRADLAEKEAQELKILNNYLPQQKSPKELEKIVDEVIEKISSRGPADFGKIMKAVMGEFKDEVDGAVVAKIVKEKLQ